MKLYLLTKEIDGLDEYDACVVCAKDEEDALTIHPDGGIFVENSRHSAWAKHKSEITCEQIGTSKGPRGVILASFNAA